MEEENKYLNIVEKFISIEEIEKFYILREKMIKAEEEITKLEQELAEKIENKPQYSGPVPYHVMMTLITEVSMEPADLNHAPQQVEKRSQSYVINFIDKEYEKLINRMYDKFTTVLQEACNELVTIPKETNDDNNTSDTGN
jgi:hypothetical protein